MLTDLGKKELTLLLVKTFGKYSFSEKELDKDFYVELYISGADFFRTEEGLNDLDFFWSDDVRSWILEDKKQWIKENGALLFEEMFGAKNDLLE